MQGSITNAGAGDVQASYRRRKESLTALVVNVPVAAGKLRGFRVRDGFPPSHKKSKDQGRDDQIDCTGSRSCPVFSTRRAAPPLPHRQGTTLYFNFAAYVLIYL